LIGISLTKKIEKMNVLSFETLRHTIYNENSYNELFTNELLALDLKLNGNIAIATFVNIFRLI